MAGGFHAARAGSLERPARVIQPNVAAGHHLPRDVHVVILEEHQMPAQLGVVTHVDDFLDQPLAFIVARMRLAGKDKLHRPPQVAGKTHKIF